MMVHGMSCLGMAGMPVSRLCCFPGSCLSQACLRVAQSGFLDSFPFDPAKLDSPTNAVKELKNGRLAMVHLPDALCMALLRSGCLPGLQRGKQRHSSLAQSARAPRPTYCLSPLTPAACCRAQIAFVGFAFAALVTRQGPIEALRSHLSDPLGNNIITNIGKLPSVISYPAVAAPAPEP